MNQTPARLHLGTQGEAVCVEQVTKRFPLSGSNGDLVAVSAVSLSVRADEFVAIIGPSGCGKTTLLQMVAGLVAPDEGQISILGQRIERPSRDVSMVFQSAALLPWAGVLQNIAFGLKLRHIPRDERLATARSLMDEVGLQSFESSLPGQLSGGMQQRVGLARALAVGPKVLLMDEPFGSLDEITRRRMQDLLLKLCGHQQMCIMLVTHSVDEAVILADRIIVMGPRPGRIIDEVIVDLPRPRTREVEQSEAFNNLRTTVWKRLEDW